ncbi:MAG: hypothetical protein HC804_14065 [Anaerolineae bacterium]|nr:hypothetical protein [Anaerolineae bacterium]
MEIELVKLRDADLAHLISLGGWIRALEVATVAVDNQFSRSGRRSSFGFSMEQIAPGLLSPRIGNTYSGSCMIGLTAILDVAEPGDRILMVSYGSGSGSDSFDLTVTDRLAEVRGNAPSTEAYIGRRKEINYATYTRYRDKLKMS